MVYSNISCGFIPIIRYHSAAIGFPNSYLSSHNTARHFCISPVQVIKPQLVNGKSQRFCIRVRGFEEIYYALDTRGHGNCQSVIKK